MVDGARAWWARRARHAWRTWGAWQFRKRRTSNLRRACRSECGQSTVEFCLVAAAFAVVVFGGWTILKIFAGGILAEHAVSSAAHVLAASPTGVLADIFSV